jgi:hypothetical protein
MRSNSLFAGASRSRQFAVWVSLFAIALRAMVPVGWMPSTAEGKNIVICTAQGLGEFFVPADENSDGTQEHQEETRDPGPCVFAATTHFFAPSVPAIPHPGDFSFSALSPIATQFLLAAAQIRLPQTRAPPVLS